MAQLSKRAHATPPSPIRKLAPLAAAAAAKGRKVYRLNIGQPDIKSPAQFFEGLQHYTQEVFAYESSQGSAALCKSWATYMNRTLGLNTSPEQFLITQGASEAIYCRWQRGMALPGDIVS